MYIPDIKKNLKEQKDVIHDDPLHKINTKKFKIALYNGLTCHHEMFGHVLEYCTDRNYKPIIYVNKTGDHGWIDYYIQKFGDISVYEHTMIDNNSNDIVFLLTDDDWAFPEKNIDHNKIICIDHDHSLRRHIQLKRVDTRLFKRTINDKWVLPVYQIVDKNDKIKIINDNTNKIHVACIGVGGIFDIDLIKKHIENFDEIEFHIFNRYKKNIHTNGYSNLHVYILESAINMIEILKKCQYSIFIPTNKIYYETSMSGLVPLSLSTGCRIITTPELKQLYKFTSCITININSDEKQILTSTTISDIDLVYEELANLIRRRDTWYDSFIEDIQKIPASYML